MVKKTIEGGPMDEDAHRPRVNENTAAGGLTRGPPEGKQLFGRVEKSEQVKGAIRAATETVANVGKGL
jgi:hypothetical protein